MTPCFRLLPTANTDLDSVADYLAGEAGIDLALRFYAAADATFAEILRMPGIGERWPTLNPRLAGLRVWRINRFPNHLAFYRPVDGGIEIIRILHAARDLEQILNEDDPPDQPLDA